MEINNHQENINKIIDWLKKKNYSVHFSKNVKDEIIFTDKIVNINNRGKLENQLYGLLHECGHLLLYKRKNYCKKFPYSSTVEYAEGQSFKKKNFKALKKSQRYWVDILSEEIEAWKEGKNLAKHLKISLNKLNYDKITSKYIFSYMRHCLSHVKKNKTFET